MFERFKRLVGRSTTTTTVEGTSSVGLVSDWDNEFCLPYKRLSQMPEVVAAVNKIAEQIASMTIHLMENGVQGDRRINNELSRLIDINPSPMMSRRTFMINIVRGMLLEGNGNAAVLPITQNGLISELKILEPSKTSFVDTTDGYYGIKYNQTLYRHDEVLHFVDNPNPNKPYMGQGMQVLLKDIINNIQGADRIKSAFFNGGYVPPIVVKIDAMNDMFKEEKRREKLYNEYLSNTKAGRPWIIPADLIEVEQIKPIALKDLAVHEGVEIDKRTIASLFGVPPYYLGVGTFDIEEHRAFVNSRILPLAKEIEQVMTKRLILNPLWYLKFNTLSLYSYDIETLSKVGKEFHGAGIMTGNEVRNWVGLSPKDDLSELIALENYIPVKDLGKQGKLSKGGEEIE